MFEQLNSSNTDILECLKITRIIAKHYNDLEILEFIENELSGYKEGDLPDYRRVQAGRYEEVIETIANVQARYKNIIDTIKLPYSYSISNVLNLLEEQEHSDKSNISMMVKTESMKKSLPMLIAPSEFHDLILSVTLRLSDYISDKIELTSKLPFEETIMNIFNRFHLIANVLKNRHSGKQPIIIEDEYDVQDLLNALLHLSFDSVQKEEYLQRFGGKNPKIDFFIPERIGIEVKKVKDRAHSKRIVEEISADKDLYSKDSRIRELYFFIYDPDSKITNRVDFKQDLEKNFSDQFDIIKVIVKPDI
jgi:hypothetical protein